MDQYRCTAPSCEFIAKSVKIAYSHKEQTGHTLELMGSGSQPSPYPIGAFGQAVLTDSPYRYFLTFNDDHILWEKQTWDPKSSKIPARVEHDQISYSKIKSITYEEIDLGPTSLFNREHVVWKGWYITLTNGMRFPITDDGKNGRMIATIKEKVKLANGKSTETANSPSAVSREVFKEVTREIVKVRCKNCNSLNYETANRCTNCGASL